VIAGAAERIGAVLAETSTLPADVGAAVITVASSHAADEQWKQFDAARIAATSPQANVRLLRALSMFPSEVLANQTLELMVGPTVRTQDAPYAIGAMATSRATGHVAWSFLKSNWAKLNDAFPDNSIPRMISPFSAQSSPEIAADIRSFFAPEAGHEVPQAKKQLQQMLERLEINVGLRSREATIAAPPTT
jgi:aminopeptidase N